MYKKIYVPVDNSAHSNLAVESAVRLGKAFGAQLVGRRSESPAFSVA